MVSITKVKSILDLSINLLNYGSRKKLFFAFLAQVFLSFLDVIGVIIFGIIGSLSVRGISNQTPGSRVSQILDQLGLQNFTLQNQVIVLSLIAVLLLVIRSFMSIYISRKTLFLLSRESAKVSKNIFANMMDYDVSQVESKSIPELQYSLTSGVNSILLGVLGNLITVLVDIFLLIVIFVGVILIDPITALSTIVVFGGSGFVSALVLPAIARRLGKLETTEAINGNILISSSINSIRELTIRNLKLDAAMQLFKIRLKYSTASANLALLPNIPKYIMESSVILGALFVSFIEFSLKDVAHAIAGLAIFIAAGTRVAPAIMRVQQGIVQINTFWAQSVSTRNLMRDFPNRYNSELLESEINFSKSQADYFTHSDFKPEIKIKNLTYTYLGRSEPAVSNMTLVIPEYSFTAIVGKSGSGKSTLIDLIIGANNGQTGEILISSLPVDECIRKWPGAISYVPQFISLIDGTVRENIAFGFRNFDISDAQLWNALDSANLRYFVESLPGQLECNIGERGTQLSGGQRQRLGIARALLTKPRLLILDEATSALDGESELEITNEIIKLRSQTTLIIIAHRLSTIIDASQVVYINDGRIEAVGTFDQIRKLSPNFNRQAELLGL